MSNLTEKAKTLGILIKENAEVWNAHNYKESERLSQTKYVSLEDAQKLEAENKELTRKLVEAIFDADKRIGIHKTQFLTLKAELDFYQEANRELIDFKRKILTEVHTPLAKIAEANKILDGEFYIENSKELVKRLREVLK